MKILCFVCPWNIEQFSVIARNISKSAQITFISPYKALDKTGLVNDYYKFLEIHDFGELSLSEMNKIKRCRILRSLNQKDSAKHFFCLTSATRKVLEQYQPDLVLSETIDSFFMDIIHTESAKRNIRFVGLVPSFVNGYFRITAKGEYNWFREPSEEEVEQVLSMLEAKEYVPTFVSDSDTLYSAARDRWIKNLWRPFYYAVKRIVSRERYNPNHWGGQIVGMQWFQLFPKFKIGDIEWRQKLKVLKKPCIYIPLQFTPEATVDYWCEDVSLIDYESTIVKLTQKLSDDFHIIIKEHPNFLGLRSSSFYKKLEGLDNVTICPTTVNSNELIELTDAVLIYTGSVGFEAALRGKPVFSLSPVYYMKGERFKVIDFSISNDEILSFLKNIKPIKLVEKKEMVAHLLTGLLQGELKNNWSWNKNNQDDIAYATDIGRLLSSYYIPTANQPEYMM